MKILVTGLLLTLLSCTSQNIQGDDTSHENNRNQEFIRQRSDEAAGRNIYKGTGFQIYKGKEK